MPVVVSCVLLHHALVQHPSLGAAGAPLVLLPAGFVLGVGPLLG